MLDACIECKALPRALDVFEEMKEQSLADVVSYNTVMKGASVKDGKVCQQKVDLWYVLDTPGGQWALLLYVVLLRTSLSYLDWFRQ